MPELMPRWDVWLIEHPVIYAYVYIYTATYHSKQPDSWTSLSRCIIAVYDARNVGELYGYEKPHIACGGALQKIF